MTAGGGYGSTHPQYKEEYVESLNVPAHVQEKLPEGWTVEDVLDAGEEGLTAIDGIGPSYARRMVEAARAIAGDESDGNTPDSPDDTELPAGQVDAAQPDSLEEPEEEPPSPLPKFVEVKLVGVETAVVGLHSMWRGEARRVLYPHYLKALANHPDAFLVRRDDSEAWGDTLS